MKTPRFVSPGRALLALLATLSLLAHAAPADWKIPEKELPEALKPWLSWATWDDKHRDCPTPYSDANKHLCFWPSRLALQATPAGGKFELTVTVFHETWVPLPGDRSVWPVDVKANGGTMTVVEHEGAPSVKLDAGTVKLEGAFRWSAIPQKIALPKQIGLLALSIDGQAVEAPVWDSQGFLWLKRDGSTEEADKNYLAVKFYGVLADGIPLWLGSDIELTVAGKSREEEFGNVLPEGWKLAAVDSPIPVAIDEAGRMKAQVRAGKWIVHTEAFRFDNPKEVRFAAGAKPAVPDALVAFRAKPDFRVVEITGLPPVDVSQTTFPDKWRDLPVFRWETGGTFRIEERMRGMGEQKTAGLKINRELWLDENGRGLTFRDRIQGEMQKIWRLDAATGEDLGAVSAGGQGQLITRNPQNGASGVEIRTRDLDLLATGRMPRAGALSATGWRSDADELHGTLNLPPGWRLFAMFGVDSVEGDWLTAWTLLDLFLLLIFTLAVFRLWGLGAAVLAFVAFGLAYHEPFAPRYLWLVLLVPLALQRVVREGRGARLVSVVKWVVLALFILALVPFIGRQAQQALYPQLEIVSADGRRDIFGSVHLIKSMAESSDYALAGETTEAEQAEQEGRKAVQRKLDSVIIPKLEFREASIRDAVDFISKKTGVSMVLRLENGSGGMPPLPPPAPAPSGVIPGLVEPPGAAPAADPNEARITIALTNVPASEALRYVTNLAGLKYKIERYAVSIVPLSTPIDTLVSKTWKVPARIFKGANGERMDARDYLTTAGITFPPGSSAIYLPDSSRLVVKNTQENLDQIDMIVESGHMSPPSSAVPGLAMAPEAPGAPDVTRGGGSFALSAPSAPRYVSENLNYDPKARIQTGPGVPEWEWRKVTFGWNGPVAASQQVKPWLISLALERVLTALRVVLLLALAAVLIGNRRVDLSVFRRFRKTAVVALFLCLSTGAWAQTPIPDSQTLEKLRSRVMERPDAFPTAAEIPFVTLTLSDRKVVTDAEVHAALRVAVPLPGRLPAWSPVTVLVDDQPASALRRDDGYLWALLEPGVHRVHVEGSLANVTDWEWTFILAPHQVKIDAPDWTVTGVKPTGVPEAQVFFARKQKAEAGAATYDRQEVQAIAQINRKLELGLIWQVHNTVTRLSPLGKAVALRVPLLPGESVLSSNAIVRDGFIEVRLGAQQQSFQWEGGLAVAPKLKLATRAEDTWVERWHLVASPVWNVTLTGLPPVFEQGNSDLVPVWQPWPGEGIELAISRPDALAGATVTVDRAQHEITLGQRQRTSRLDLSLRCTLGEDFLVELPAEAEITALTQNGKSLPVRKDGRKVIVPLRPGEQSIVIEWKSNLPLGLLAQTGEVRLPVESANIQTILHVPDNRWVLGAGGPRRGPAVRFWGILICSLLAAVVLGRVAASPLRAVEWMLLAIGLTQVPLIAALTVVAWLFLLAWRGGDSFQRRGWITYDLLQLLLIVLTAVALGILVTAVGEGLLGNPEMFITGNSSTRTVLRWFQARSDRLLPGPGFVSISIWWYRFAMLVWALWLAAALLRWLRRGWQDFSRGGFFRWRAKKPVAAAAPASMAMPPPLHPPPAA
jgi:hypothetical protein